MFHCLTPEDFPLYAIGSFIYRRTFSSPLFTAPNEAIAADLVFRLNDQEMRKWGPLTSADWRSVPETTTTLVFGKMSA
jgi:hypothetical protein